MAGAFSPAGPGPRQLTPDEEYQRFLANAKGSAASFADPFGLTTLLGPDSIAQPLKEAQEGGSAATNLFGALAFPMGAVTAAPKTVAALTGLGAFFGGADTADAQERQRKKQKVKLSEKPVQAEAQATDEIGALVDKWKGKDPSLGALYSTYNDAKLASRANVQGVDKASADEVRRRANEDADKTMREIMERIEKLDPPKQTFGQRYGKLAEAWPWIQAGTGIGVGALMGGKARLSDDMFKYRPWQRSLDRFDEAINPNPGMMSRLLGRGNNPSRAYTEAERIKGFADNIEPKGALSGMGMPVVAGGVASAEVGMLPDAYNLKYAPQDSEDYKRAEQHLSGAGEAAKAYGPMVALSALGAATGGKVVGAKDKQPGLSARSQPALERLGQGQRSERAANFRASVQDDIDLANMGRPQPKGPGPQPGPQPGTPPPGAGPTPPSPPPGVGPNAAGPGAGPAGPGPVKPPRQPRQPVGPRVDKATGNTMLDKALSAWERGKPFRLPKDYPAESGKRLKQTIDNLPKGMENDPMGRAAVASSVKGMRDSGQLKNYYGTAGVATGYSAVLAQRLAEMQSKDEIDQ